MPRSCVRAPATRGARIATRMSAGKKTTSKVSNQVAAAAALTALTASAPALAAVNEVGQVAGAEFLPSVLVRSCDTKPTRSTERVKSTADRSPRPPPPPPPPLSQPSGAPRGTRLPWNRHGRFLHLPRVREEVSARLGPGAHRLSIITATVFCITLCDVRIHIHIPVLSANLAVP